MSDRVNSSNHRGWTTRITLLALGLLLACDDETSRPEQVDRFAAAIAAAEQTIEESFASGLSIAVMRRGELLWVEGIGSASPNEERAITPDTTFQIGSTTKQLTAMAVLTQVDQGLYALEDTVAEVLPDFALAANPEWADTATVRDLLNHRSGLTDEIGVGLPAADEGLADHLYDQIASNKWAMNPPGLFWNYSNTNFALAGLILEEHDPLGRAYADIVTEDLFEPLGMTRSYGRVSDAQRAGLYADSFGADARSIHLGVFPDLDFGERRAQTIDEIADDAYNRPAGGSAFSTPSDMCRWGHFVLHGDRDVIRDEVRAEMIAAPVDTLLNDAAGYGLGQFAWSEFPLTGDPFLDTEYYPIAVWEHGGNTHTFTSSLLIVPGQDIVVSILSNGEGTDHGPVQAAILEAVLDPLPEPTTRTPEIDQTKLAALAGTYVDEHVAGEITIAPGGSTGLTIAIPAFEERGFEVKPELIPISTYVWIVQVGEIGIDLTFVTDDGVPTPWLRSRLFVAQRSPAA